MGRLIEHDTLCLLVPRCEGRAGFAHCAILRCRCRTAGVCVDCIGSCEPRKCLILCIVSYEPTRLQFPFAPGWFFCGAIRRPSELQILLVVGLVPRSCRINQDAVFPASMPLLASALWHVLRSSQQAFLRLPPLLCGVGAKTAESGAGCRAWLLRSSNK